MKKGSKKNHVPKKAFNTKPIVKGHFFDKSGKKVVYQNHDHDKTIYFDC